MATAFERAIRAQPAQLREALALDVSGAAAALAGVDRVVVVGTGTSFHAARLGAAMLACTGLDARAARSLELLSLGPPLRPGDGVIAISHSGTTAFACAARARALELGLPLVSLTGTAAPWPEALRTSPPEPAETHTGSYLTALVVLARLAGALGAVGLADAVERVPDAVAAALAAADVPRVDPGVRALVLAGVGPSAVTAAEAALKCREAAGVLAEGFDAETLLHGHAVPLRAGDGLVLVSAGDDTLGFLDGLGRAARAEGIVVHPLADGSGLPPLLAQLPLTARAQLLALRLAAARRTDPDVVVRGAWADDALWSLGRPAG
ncbi:MAG: SIS domain-containing protein [Thermoleophilia bacterium]